MTQLHAGGKFDQNSYKVSGGLHGVGVSVVNALSDWLQLKIWRDGKIHEMRFERGDAVVAAGGHRRGARCARTASRLTGTRSPSCRRSTTFAFIEFDRKTLEHRLRELAFLNSGVTIRFQRPARRRAVRGDHALRRRRRGLRAPPRQGQDAAAQGPDRGARQARDRSRSTSPCGGTTATTRHMLCFTNNIPQRDGGTHLAAFRAALTRVITGYVESSGAAKREKVSVSGEDAREGLTCVLSVKLPDPKFSLADQGQAGLLRGAPGGGGPGRRGPRRLVRGASDRGQADRPEDRRGRRRPRGRPQGPRADPAQVGAGHHLPARQARRLPGEATRPSRRSSSSRATAPAARPSRRRNRENQAILPLRGKILNVERARFDKMLGVRADRHPDHRARRRHRPRRLRHREDPLPQDRHDDRRRRRRRPHPHPAADLLLPADAGGDRARLPLYRPAAAL